MQGVYALVLMHRDEPHRLVAARMGPPLVIGLGEGEHYVASDIPALLPHTRDFVFLEDGDVAVVCADAVQVTNLAGDKVARPTQRIAWDPVQAEKGGYRHFMLKEIHEQPRAMRDTLLGRISLEEGEVHLEELGPAARALQQASRVVLLACGTSWHAALVGKFWIEHLAGLPAEVDYGSEFRYRTPLVGPGTVAIAISQSGETADTLAAFREAKARGARRHRHLQRAGLDADARGHGLAADARRAGDRRGLDEGLHRTAGRAGAAGAAPGTAARHAAGRGLPRAPLAPDPGAASDGAGARGASPRSRRCRARCRTRATSSTSGAASTTRSRSRGRSS